MSVPSGKRWSPAWGFLPTLRSALWRGKRVWRLKSLPGCGVISCFQTIEGRNERESIAEKVPDPSPRGGNRRGDVLRGVRKQGCAAGGGRHGERRRDQGHRTSRVPRRPCRRVR